MQEKLAKWAKPYLLGAGVALVSGYVFGADYDVRPMLVVIAPLIAGLFAFAASDR